MTGVNIGKSIRNTFPMRLNYKLRLNVTINKHFFSSSMKLWKTIFSLATKLFPIWNFYSKTHKKEHFATIWFCVSFFFCYQLISYLVYLKRITIYYHHSTITTNFNHNFFWTKIFFFFIHNRKKNKRTTAFTFSFNTDWKNIEITAPYLYS